MLRGIRLVLFLAVPLAILAGTLAYRARVAPAADAPGAYDYVVRVELPPAERVIDLPQVQGPQDAGRPLVVIDPGHGGFDPGAGQGAVKEKEVTLAIARALRDRLLEAGGIRVAMTREDDRFIALAERPNIARRLGADVFVSIHADSADAEGARGASVYVLSESGSSQAASRFAARENGADTVNGVNLSETSDTVGAILLDLSQREAQAGSAELAGLVLREAAGRIPLRREGIESAGLAVLKAPDVPSILFETGYISNPEDAAYINSVEGRETIASAAAAAIRTFLVRRTLAEAGAGLRATDGP